MGNKQGKKLNKEDMDFLLKNTNFSKQQIKQWYKGFMRDCPCGQLSRKKFMEVYSQFYPNGNAEKFCEHVFRTFDSDNSGKIDFKEFLQAINITSAGKPEDKLVWAFTMYDIDGNGTIEKHEMLEIIKAIYKMVGDVVEITDYDNPESRTEEIFVKMDTNGDGVLTQDEFINGCMQDDQLRRMLTAEAPEEIDDGDE